MTWFDDISSPPRRPPAARRRHKRTRERPTIRITTDEEAVNTAALRALAAGGYRDLFQRGGHLARVVRLQSRPDAPPGDRQLRPADGTPAIRQLALSTLRERIAHVARWQKYDARSKDYVDAHPPMWAVQAVAERGEYPGVAPLRGVGSYPMIRPDGSISCREGYDAGTGYYLSGLPRDLKVPDRPTQADAQRAAEQLLRLVGDFPFRTDIDRSGWLAYLLTPLARAVIDGPTPLFVIEATVRGTGKTLLADTAGLVLTGSGIPKQTYTRRDEELEKLYVSVALQGLAVICWDNVGPGTTIGGPVTDKWLTDTQQMGRILGKSDTPAFEWLTVQVVTANNASISGDTDRRTVYVGLRTEHERPEHRSDFEIADLPAYIKAHRGELLSHALVILKAHYVAGLPASTGLHKGTFEGWQRRVRDAVMFAGLVDCERPADDPDRPVDQDTAELAALLSGLWECFQEDSFTVAAILEAAYPGPDRDPWRQARNLRDALAQMAYRGDRPSRQWIGKRLAAHRLRWVDDMRLCSEVDAHSKRNAWRIETRGEIDRVTTLSDVARSTDSDDSAIGANSELLF